MGSLVRVEQVSRIPILRDLTLRISLRRQHIPASETLIRTPPRFLLF